jgi:predicted glycoside hydrolase/deacetylase ChbG (UPF0249 family)
MEEKHSKSLGVAVPVSSKKGALIVNADDWGRSREVTDRTLDCVLARAVSSTSAMVFMDDSDRAAKIARDNGVDAGLHLNLTSPFTGTSGNQQLHEQQQRVAKFLRASRLCPAIYHPGLTRAFEYVVRAQMDEYARLYDNMPRRIDGHHHMHLCANVQFQKLLPEGTIARRNFSFAAGEKSALNRLYRSIQDKRLRTRHRTTDYFFSIQPLESDRLAKIRDLMNQYIVELETHPVNPDEYSFLTDGRLRALLQDSCVAKGYIL